jgi:hypothetical protein
MSDDKKPTAPAISADAMAAAIKMVSEQMIPAAVAAAVSAVSRQNQPAAAPARPSNAAPARCSACGQQATACGGKHMEMVVFPLRYPQHAEYFMGVSINGIKYLSNDENHKVVVPENAAGSIKSIVQGFEQNEQDMAVGRKATRHSGSVSPHGNSVSPASQAWR